MTPLLNFRVTSPYGYREYRNNGRPIKEIHRGQDLVAPDTNVRAIWDCVKVETSTGYNSGRGNLIRLYYSNTLRCICQHMGSFSVNSSSKVKQGDIIGKYGNTGNTTGPHLHIEVQALQRGTWVAVEPTKYTEIPNKVGTYQGNNNFDNKSPSPVTLQTVTIGPVSEGDKNAILSKAHDLILGDEVKPIGGLFNVKVGPMSPGDIATIKDLGEKMKTPSNGVKVVIE